MVFQHGHLGLAEGVELDAHLRQDLLDQLIGVGTGIRRRLEMRRQAGDAP